MPRELNAPQPTTSTGQQESAQEGPTKEAPGLSATGPAPPQGAAQDLLAEARRLRQEGMLRDAFSAYRLWLERNPNHPGFAEILGEASAWAPDVLLAADLLGRFSPRIEDAQLREQFLLRQARLLIAVGRFEDSQRLLSAPAASIARMHLQALVLYQQGELEGCLDVLREALSDLAASSGEAAADAGGGALEPVSEQELQARMYLLMAQAYGVLGRAGEAESLYLLLQKRYEKTAVAPAAYLEYHRFLASLGRAAEAASLAAELRQRFPGSPEAGLVPAAEAGADTAEAERGAAVVYASSPLRLLPAEILSSAAEPSRPGAELLAAPSAVPASSPPSPSEPKGAVEEARESRDEKPAAMAAGKTTTDPTAKTATEPAGKISAQPAGAEPPLPPAKALVQTGSFRDRENAQYMVRDLKEAGFAAEIRETSLDGRLYYRVTIGPAMTPEEAQKLMLRLKVAGFEGFLLFLD